MVFYTTLDAARKLGIPYTTLVTYLTRGKIPFPANEIAGKTPVQIWTEAEIENVRQLLPKIANGRKTRYQKLRATQKKDAQKQKAQTKKPVPRKRKKPKS